MTEVATSSALSDEDYQDAAHFRDAAENASRDADQLVAKLATAGLTVSVAVAGLVDDASIRGLGWAATGFGLAAIVSVVNQRLGADTLRKLCERTYEVGARAARESLSRHFAVLQVLNWLSVGLIVVGFGVATTFTFQMVAA